MHCLCVERRKKALAIKIFKKGRKKERKKKRKEGVG
jgi:hypothetical protein